MKNPSKCIVREIQNWFEKNGYHPRHVFTVNTISISISKKLSDNDLKKFYNEFKTDLILEGASYEESGRLREVNYKCDCPALKNFRNHLCDWLEDHEFPFSFFIIGNEISLYCFDKLSDEQISDFMNAFEIKNMKYKVSCNSNEITYEFSS